MEPKLTPDEKHMLETLDFSLSPFEKFVAKADLEETLPLVSDRAEFMHQVIHLINQGNRTEDKKIIPLYSSTGVGKTYILWQLKKSLEVQSRALFMEVPANSQRWYYNLYTSIIEEIGVETIREITMKIADSWGANEKKFGLFRTSDASQVLENAQKTKYYQTNAHQDAAAEIIRVIIAHAMEPEKTSLAERWLFGEIMDMDELFFIGVEKNLSDPNVAHELLKLLLYHLNEGIIIMFDDLDKKWRQYNVYDSFNEDEEEDWTETSSNSLPDQTDHAFLDEIVKLVLEYPHVKIIFTVHEENLEEMLNLFDPSQSWVIATPLEIPTYSMSDAKQYFLDALEAYRQKHNLTAITNNPYFPLSEKLIYIVFEYAQGNPRKIIRTFQKLFDAIVIDEWTIPKLEHEYQALLK